MSHNAKAVVLHCMDFRFIHAIVHFLKDEGYRDQYDDVSIAGAAKNFADPYDASDTELIYRQIEISKKLHGITDVILINHMDCGAYGGRRDFQSLKEEHERHVKDLHRAKEMVEHHFADDKLNVMLVLADITEDGKITFEKVA